MYIYGFTELLYFDCPHDVITGKIIDDGLSVTCVYEQVQENIESIF